MILELRNVSYRYRAGALALDDVSIAVGEGQSVGLVGESGSGKSTIVRLMLALATPTSGSVLFEGEPIVPARLRRFRASVQTVFQDPYSSLDPRQNIESIVAEPLRSLGIARGAEARTMVAESLAAVGLPADVLGRFPQIGRAHV